MHFPCSGPEGLTKLEREMPKPECMSGSQAELSRGYSSHLQLVRWEGLGTGDPELCSDLDSLAHHCIHPMLYGDVETILSQKHTVEE